MCYDTSGGPEFIDHAGETGPRDFDGVAGLHYRNNSGRNDIVAAKVARDSSHVYFYVRTAAPITPSTGSDWMWLMIDSDQNPYNGWQGFDFVVNRVAESDSITWLEKNDGGWRWKKVGPVKFRVQGNELHLAIPRKMIGQGKTAQPMKLDFKWADNLQQPGDPLDFLESGDVAPEGRFKYRYTTR